VSASVPAPDATGLLAELVDLGVLDPTDVVVADTLGRLWSGASDDPLVRLGVALAVRAPRMGHVCCDLAVVADSVTAEVPADRATTSSPDVGEGPSIDRRLDGLGWPTVEAWQSALAASPLVLVASSGGDGVGVEGNRPVVLWGTKLYLQRLWTQEAEVARGLRALAAEPADVRGAADVVAALLDGEAASDQRRAVGRALAHRLGVIAGGPGTGKTTTIAALLMGAHAAADGSPPRVVLAAPTGKAAARVNEALADALARFASTPLSAEHAPVVASALASLEGVEASTLHGLLGASGGPRASYRHDARNPLPHDVVVVDEASMVALPLMAHLLAAVGPHTRLILVGDPHQLASVEAGSVLADIVVPPEGVTADVGPLAEVTTVLTTNFRFAEESGIAEVARAVNAGLGDDAVAALSGRPDVAWHAVDAAAAPGRAVVLDELVGPGSDVVALARSGDADGALVALGACQLLCAHRRGPYGVEAWNRHVGGRLGVTASSPAGRPVLVTRNDSDLGVFNGDVGVVVADGESTRVAFGSAAGTRRLAPVQLEHTETAHALTIHKSQGSEFGVVVVVLPPDGSRLASRQLLYTAVTRAKDRVVVVGTESAVRTAVGRSLARQGGLAERLWCEG